MQLIADNLTILRGSRTVLEKLSFAVSSGEALLLTGPNGAGKTTLIRAIAGFLQPAEGSLLLQDDSVEGDDGGTDDGRTISEQSHYVGHLNAVKASLTVEENLGFWAQYLATNGLAASGLAYDGPPASIEDALERFDLVALRYIPGGYLSAGQKRRVGLARLLVAKRPLWLLDEPTVSLDHINRDVLAGVVNDHVEAGGMVIAATHLPLGFKDPRELHLDGLLRAQEVEA